MKHDLLKRIVSVQWTVILLSLLLLIHIFTNLAIIRQDATPLKWDGGDYFYRSLRYYDVVTRPAPGFVSRFLEVSPYRPPLFLLTSVPLYAIFGRSPDVGVMTNALYTVVLLLSVYSIGKTLRDPGTGLLAALLVSTFPLLFGLSRSYWVDYALTAMVTLSIALLLKTECFGCRRYVYLFGVSLGLGMLTKWTYFIFVLGPFVYFLLVPQADQGKPVRDRLGPGSISVLIGAAVAAFWYVPNGLDVVRKLLGLAFGVRGAGATRFEQLGETIGPSGLFNPAALLYYAGKLVNEQITMVYAVIFIAFTILLFKRDRSQIVWLLLWIAVPVLVFTLIKNKTERNTVPMLPAIGILISLGVMSINGRRLRRIMAALVCCWGLFSFCVSTYGAPFSLGKVSFRTRIGEVVLFQRPENTSYALYRPDRRDWKMDEILDAIRSDAGNRTDVRVVLVPRDAITWMSLDYGSYLRDLPFKFIGAVDDPEAVLSADFVLVKKGGFVAPWFGMKNIHRSLDLMRDRWESYSLIKSVIIPEVRTFLPVYDLEATRNDSWGSLTFSDRLELLGYRVSTVKSASGRQYDFSLIVRALDGSKGDLLPVFSVLNRKMDVLMTKSVATTPAIRACCVERAGEVAASLSVPSAVAGELFSIELGFCDSGSRTMLNYHPEYLVYKGAGPVAGR